MNIETDNQTPSENTEIEAVDTPSAADLDAYSEFMFQGEKYTPETLSEVLKAHKEMSDLNSSYNQEAKFFHNLEADLKKIKANPSLADQFKSVYPQKFHTYLDYALPAKEISQGKEPQTPGIPKEYLDKIMTMEQKIQMYEQETYQSKVQAAQAEIDQTLGKLKEKYPNADDDLVLARAEVLVQKGQKITAGTWERLAKESHESFVKRSDLHHKTILKQQLQKGQKGADMGVGGSAGQEGPPKRMSFAEATEAAVRRVTGR